MVVEANDTQESLYTRLASIHKTVLSGLKSIIDLIKSEIRLFYPN